MMTDIALLDLFSGIGGFSLGLSDAGFNITRHMYSEVDKHAIANYKYNFKNSEYVGSITTLDGSTIPRPNIITFGSPCQDFSVAGKRAGMGGTRSSLIGEAIRLIAECRPDIFIWENVKGVFSSNSGADFWGVIQAFTNIGGYRLEWQLLNTAWVLPQNRERVYLIGHLTEAGRDFKGVFPISESNKLFTKSLRSERRGRGENNTQQLEQRADGITNTLTGVQKDNMIIVPSATKQGFELAQEGDSINLKQPTSKTRRGRVGKGIAQTLETQPGQAIVFVGGINPHNRGDGSLSRDYSEQDRVYDAELSKEAATVAATSNSKYLHNSQIRRLTEIECERLQGFPDGWTESGDYDGVIKKIPKTQRYKLLGNAVTKTIVEMIGVRLLVEFADIQKIV